MNQIKMRTKNNLKPIIFVFGPSGVGKSYISELVKKQKLLYVHIDTDSRKRTFAANGFPSEWDNDFSKIDYDYLVSNLQKGFEIEHEGVVVSFPTILRFTQENLNLLGQLGVVPILVWGSEENCKRAAKVRINKKGLQFNLGRYDEKNSQTFQLYGRPEYDIYRMEAFRADGSRFSDEELKKQIEDFIRKFISG